MMLETTTMSKMRMKRMKLKPSSSSSSSSSSSNEPWRDTHRWISTTTMTAAVTVLFLLLPTMMMTTTTTNAWMIHPHPHSHHQSLPMLSWSPTSTTSRRIRMIDWTISSSSSPSNASLYKREMPSNVHNSP